MTGIEVFRTSIFVLVIFLELARAEFHLELVHVLLRHGDRTPRKAEMYPKDPYPASIYEPFGLGQLTNQGKMREYRIGKMIRQRYDQFLGDTYRSSDVYAVSTDPDRTKMSLELVLAGLYPPNAKQLWNKNLTWNPIPILYTPEIVDGILKPHNCPIYQEELQKVRSSEEIRGRLSAYNGFFKYLSENTGRNINQSNPFGTVSELAYITTAQQAMGLTLPAWCTSDVVKKMDEILMLDYETRSYTTKMKRVNGGMLIKQFVKHMNLDGKNNSTRKIFLYSAHETNIAGLVRAHGFTMPKIPEYGSTILFEKWRNEANKIFAKMVLWTGVTERFFTYKFPGCDTMCPIEQYLKLVHDIIPSEQESNCLWDNVRKEDLKKFYT